ncbi:superoxide dismutase, Fe-Mn family [Methylophilus rhizosphaerae]|uniref:Superoxide dismutase n=1 Tax=Methylophilus rhizosphaerae TaxID=492660 RepID=A0A1G9BFM0_9PROT|nr:superoxide dismutase [Methylophilus rhizosphaerae]SDK37655.1 superoxide dismutase, Fe-Mn family [Methylophilus rhizosphaerae]
MPHSLPPLPYAVNALEPYIDTQTMEIHHQRHHQAYINNLNTALTGSGLEEEPVEQLLRRFDSLPEKLQTAVRNQGGGHANHTLFWSVMTPAFDGQPSADLLSAIDKDLGGLDAFKTAFTQAAISRFGSGWAWLSVNPQGKLIVESSGNQDSPLMHGNTPVLGLDVWEHAYYLRYQNKRPEYIAAFYHVINWPEVERRWREAINA